MNKLPNSAEAQRKRALDHLKKHGSITTIEMRRDLDILMPAARIHELRHKFGHPIETVRCIQATECGKLHRVARYIYRAKSGSNRGMTRCR